MEPEQLPHKLDDLILSLRRAMKAFPADAEHFVADNALYSLAIDVLEQSVAVQILRGSEVPRSAFPNARAAFEAGQDILYLTSDEHAYDRYGCLARVHEVYEAQRLQTRFDRANTEAGLSSQEVQNVESLILTDAADWDTVVAGRGSLLRDALAEFQARKSNERKHWTGLSREQIGMAVAVQLQAEDGVGPMYDAIYGSLSTHSHPTMRMDQRTIEAAESGQFLFSSKPSDRNAPATAAAFGCISAIEALDRRSRFFSLP